MRLLDRVLDGGVWQLPFDGHRPTWIDARKWLKPIPPIRVIGDEVAALYWRSPKLEWHFADDFGPLRLPFPNMWVEGRQPSSGYTIEGPYTNGRRESIGALLASWSGGVDALTTAFEDIIAGRSPALPTTTTRSDDGSIIACIPFLEAHGRVYNLPLLLLEIDAEGRFVGREVKAVVGPGENVDSLVEASCDAAKVPMLIVSFMNCRNVSVEPAPVRHTTRSARRRSNSGRPALRFSEVHLPGTGHQSLAGAKRAAGPGVSAHLVRGHFKTYTEDLPLLGRHTGTWWWNWQARGSGPSVVIPHYEVKP